MKKSADRILAQYVVEKELAKRLRDATKEERRFLYSAVYDELFTRVPDHNQILENQNPDIARRRTSRQMSLLKPMLDPEMTILEIGAGGCHLIRRLEKRVRKIYAIDVSRIICPRPAGGGGGGERERKKIIISDGVSIPVPPCTVDLAFSDQTMEHLHPDDALDHLRNVYDTLKPGGHYLCSTPNRLCGPRDISRYFDDTATGLHLKEYTYEELETMFRRAGFRKFRALIGVSRVIFRCRTGWLRSLERAIGALPFQVGKWIARPRYFLIGPLLLNIRLVAEKGSSP